MLLDPISGTALFSAENISLDLSDAQGLPRLIVGAM